MKRRIPTLCLLLVSAVVLAVALMTTDEVTKLESSKPSGFYEEPFYLELRAPEGYICYTLDGSDPDLDGLLYTGPILIEDASEHENVLSAREDLDGFVYSDLQSIGIELPKQKVDKATILRAAYYDTTGIKTEEVLRSYFVGFQNKPGYEDMEVLSIVTDPENLTNYETGIFVRGKRFDEEIQDGGVEGNYSNRGPDWEREARFQYFGTDGELLYEAPCGIRIMGGWHRLSVLKSFNLYARKEYGDSDTFDYDFFGTSLRPHKLTIHSGSNDYYGKIQNLMVSNLTRGLDMGTLNYRICVLFLNGEYWGIYNLTEKYDSQYLAQTYGVDKDDVISVKAGERENGSAEDFHLYTEAVEFLEESDLTLEENYRKFQELFDEQSLLDLFATEIYCARHSDWPNGNIHLWRTVSSDGEGYGDGRWRYLLYDLDSLGLTEDLIEHDTLQSAMDDCAYFRSLCRNETFRKKLGANILRLGAEYLSPERVNPVIDSYQTMMEEPMKVYYQRFFNSDSQRFYERMSSNRNFFEGRMDAMKVLLEAHDMMP